MNELHDKRKDLVWTMEINAKQHSAMNGRAVITRTGETSFSVFLFFCFFFITLWMLNNCDKQEPRIIYRRNSKQLLFTGDVQRANRFLSSPSLVLPRRKDYWWLNEEKDRTMYLMQCSWCTHWYVFVDLIKSGSIFLTLFEERTFYGDS